MSLYNIRPAKPEDMNFVMATFLRGLYYGDPWFTKIPKDIFMSVYKQIAQKAWENPNVRIKVACLKEDDNVILGYSVLSADNSAILWVFVKMAFRNQGIARSLVPESPMFVTHLTELGKTLLPKLNGAVFNPFL